MDYVQKAIEKARRERQGRTGALGRQGRQSTDSVARGRAGELKVEYTRTRQAQPDRRVLMDQRVIAAFDDDDRAEPFRQLRTQLLRTFRANGWRSLAITSARGGAGKTFTAINLAIALAREVTQTVLLVDLDLAKPDVAQLMGINVEHGLVDHLMGDMSLEKILVNPGFERLVLLPSLHVDGPTSEILSAPRTKQLLQELVDRYTDRLIIFDLPPLLRDDDAMVMTPLADATLLVVEEGVTTKDDLERCSHLLAGSNVLGTVLNKAQ